MSPGESTVRRSLLAGRLHRFDEQVGGVREPVRQAATPVLRRVRAPVDGDHEPGIEQQGGLGRPRRIEVAGPERRSPPPDRQQGEVDVGERTHAVEEVGVAGEVDTLAVVFARLIGVDDVPHR